MSLVLIMTLCAASWGLLAPLQIEVPDPDAQIDPKTYTCAEHLELLEAEDGRSEVRTVWAHGYHSALKGVDQNSPPISVSDLLEFSGRLEDRCRQEPEALFFKVLKQLD